jgi:hypothetical protein
MGSDHYNSSGGFAQANSDFDALTQGQPVTDYGNGIRPSQLPDGSSISVRPMSGQGSPTIQVNPTSGGNPIKIRY